MDYFVVTYSMVHYQHFITRNHINGSVDLFLW